MVQKSPQMVALYMYVENNAIRFPWDYGLFYMFKKLLFVSYLHVRDETLRHCCVVLNLSTLKKSPKPYRIVLECSAIFKNVEHRFDPGETLSYSASHCALISILSFLNVTKHSEITTKFRFDRTEAKPEITGNYINSIMPSIRVYHTFDVRCCRSNHDG